MPRKQGEVKGRDRQCTVQEDQVQRRAVIVPRPPAMKLESVDE